MKKSLLFIVPALLMSLGGCSIIEEIFGGDFEKAEVNPVELSFDRKLTDEEKTNVESILGDELMKFSDFSYSKLTKTTEYADSTSKILIESKGSVSFSNYASVNSRQRTKGETSYSNVQTDESSNCEFFIYDNMAYEMQDYDGSKTYYRLSNDVSGTNFKLRTSILPLTDLGAISALNYYKSGDHIYGYYHIGVLNNETPDTNRFDHVEYYMFADFGTYTRPKLYNFEYFFREESNYFIDIELEDFYVKKEEHIKYSFAYNYLEEKDISSFVNTLSKGVFNSVSPVVKKVVDYYTEENAPFVITEQSVRDRSIHVKALAKVVNYGQYLIRATASRLTLSSNYAVDLVCHNESMASVGEKISLKTDQLSTRGVIFEVHIPEDDLNEYYMELTFDVSLDEEGLNLTYKVHAELVL